jgi:hypothetical protein
MAIGSKLLLLGVVLQAVNTSLLLGIFYIFYIGGWW